METIRNKVKESGLVQLDLAHYKPKYNLVGLDLAGQLWQGLVLKEKDFRAWIKTHDWKQYLGSAVYIFLQHGGHYPNLGLYAREFGTPK